MRLSVLALGLTVKRMVGSDEALHIFVIPRSGHHPIATKRKGGSCTQVSRPGNYAKPARPRAPYAQPPSSTDRNVRLMKLVHST